MLDSVFWHVFLNTGDLNSYLAYKDLEESIIIRDEEKITEEEY
ncbi:MAG: YqzL family protein [Anaeromicrobium sp.]|jgi:nitrogen fixation protein|nr:YqzL family protein [Anaeromicrobium sp.]MCT4594584.1 YqzL family protein [Anaeromicrobium sp.]